MRTSERGWIMSKVAQRIGQRVKEERKSQKITQTELANLSGVGLNFVSQLEQGKASVQLDKVLLVLETLGLTIDLKYLK